MNSKIEVPNYTQIPNVCFDNIMSKINGSEFKVLMAISRKTFGWHKESDRISYSQIMEMTGISSKETVNNSIKKLVSKDIIKLEKVGQVSYYTINVTEIEPVQKSNRYENCTGDSTKIVPVSIKTGTKIVHTKEKNLNKDKENIKECNEGLFLEFYKQYPKKTNKTDARKVFFSLLKQKVTLELILERLNAYKYQIYKNNTELQYVRNPARFLRSLEDFEEINVEEEKKEPGIKKKVKLYCKKCGSILEDCVCTQCYALHDMQGELL